MKIAPAALVLAVAFAAAAQGDMCTDWAYHAAGPSGQATEKVPGENFAFLANGSAQVDDGDTVTMYVLTARDFAGEMDEQIFVRWWDGAMSHWIMGAWVKSVVLDASKPETQFHGQPAEGTVALDLWKIDVPPWITQPGDNYYAIQIKGYAAGTSEERYLLSRSGGDFSQINNLGQVWSASEEFDGQDWHVAVTP